MLEARKAGEGSAHATSLITGSEIDVRRRTRTTTPPSSTIFPNPIIYSPVRETLNPRFDELFVVLVADEEARRSLHEGVGEGLHRETRLVRSYLFL